VLNVTLVLKGVHLSFSWVFGRLEQPEDKRFNGCDTIAQNIETLFKQFVQGYHLVYMIHFVGVFNGPKRCNQR
jgi:hypothetical protein